MSRQCLTGICSQVQIHKLFELIENQLTRLQFRMPAEQVAHLVLSGGLGNSTYVQSQLRARYSSSYATFPNTRNLQVRVAPEPQLVVCKGIVADRVQKLRSGKSMLGWRCSRSSYGTLCKVLHDPTNPQHYGQKTAIDSLDGKTYVTGCVNWFIKQVRAVHMIMQILILTSNTGRTCINRLSDRQTVCSKMSSGNKN
jgi:hypothetical protein